MSRAQYKSLADKSSTAIPIGIFDAVWTIVEADQSLKI